MRSSLVSLLLAGCGFPGFPSLSDAGASAVGAAAVAETTQPRVEFTVSGSTVAHHGTVADYPVCSVSGGALTFRNLNDQSNPSLQLTVQGFSASATSPLTNLTGTFFDGTSLFPGPAFAVSNCQFVVGFGSSASRLSATFTCGTLRDAAGNLAQLSDGTLLCCVDC